jgi:hypothetical protein
MVLRQEFRVERIVRFRTVNFYVNVRDTESRATWAGTKKKPSLLGTGWAPCMGLRALRGHWEGA